MKVVWRDLVTVLTEEEVLDKGFSRAKKSADRVDDPVKVFRVRKQLQEWCRLLQMLCRNISKIPSALGPV